MEAVTGRKQSLLLDIVYDIVGCAIFSVGVQCFYSPNDIAPGGVSGLSIVLNYLFGIRISILNFVLNIPLLLLAWLMVNRRFTLKTVKTVVILTLVLELASRVLPEYHGNLILASLFGGVLQGVGLALVFMRGSTTGGTDVASRLIQTKLPHVPVGKLILLLDAVVLLIAALTYRNIENALYGMIAIFTCTRILDGIIYGLDTGRVIMIFSQKHKEIADKILVDMDRGCTVLSAKGSYTDQDQPVLLCAVRKPQFFELKELVHEADPRAFLVALEANEIIGEGFKDPNEKGIG